MKLLAILLALASLLLGKAFAALDLKRFPSTSQHRSHLTNLHRNRGRAPSSISPAHKVSKRFTDLASGSGDVTDMTVSECKDFMQNLWHKANTQQYHTYIGLQGMQWPLSILKDKKHQVTSSALSTSNTQIKSANTGYDKPATGEDYSSSPSFYPSPKTLGLGSWTGSVKKARTYLKDWTLEEKVNLVTGVGWQVGSKPRCVGNIAPNERLQFPGLCLEDSPLGVRFADLVSVFPAGITTAATFSSRLAFERGEAMGEEFRKKGVNVQLGPGMNLHRSAAAGRNWEMGGADPYLSGESAYHTIKGIQSQGVQACAKHLVANEQEINRNTYSSNIDGRTMREIYLHPFLRSVQADVASIMCSYNLNNNSWSCQNSELLNNLVKTEMGFQGYVMSDWGAQHSGVSSANSGLDMTMPGQTECCDKNIRTYFWGKNLTTAINNGSVEMSRLEDMGTRILAAWYLLGQDKAEYPKKPNFDAFDSFYGDHVTATSQKHSKIMREIGSAGTVLLKNSEKALPLRKNMRKIAVLGEDSGPSMRGANEFPDRGGIDGVIGTGWGSGSTDYSYLISPYEALQQRTREHNIGFAWSFDNYALGRASSISDERLGVDAAIVFVHADSGEGYITVDGNLGDRNNLTLWGNGEELIKAVTSVQRNTIVVIHAPGQIDMEAWIDNPNVTAVLHAHMPGAEAGNAITDVLFGEVNPSGRLPYTIAKKRTDYASDVIYFNSTETKDSQLYYSERLNIDYRHFDAKNIEPRFAFGFGLSYTSFAYSDLHGTWLDGKDYDWNQKKWSWPIPEWMFEDVYEVTFIIHNTGQQDGHEVPQLYIGFPQETGEPPKVLRRFDRYGVKAGKSRRIVFRLNRYDLSIWSNEENRWMKPIGNVSLYVGSSSRDIKLIKKRM